MIGVISERIENIAEKGVNTSNKRFLLFLLYIYMWVFYYAPVSKDRGAYCFTVVRPSAQT